MPRFKDRRDGAAQLLPKLKKFEKNPNALVLGLPRGGMVTASEIAKGLNIPLGFLVVKKVGAPDNPELAIGAVTDRGESYLDEELISSLKINKDFVENEIKVKKGEAQTKANRFKAFADSDNLMGKTVILVDDGIATGATMIAAVRSARCRGAGKIIVASPTGAGEAVGLLKKEADEIMCLNEKAEFSSAGEYYDSFPEVTDEEVIEILKNAKNSFNI